MKVFFFIITDFQPLFYTTKVFFLNLEQLWKITKRKHQVQSVFNSTIQTSYYICWHTLFHSLSDSGKDVRDFRVCFTRLVNWIILKPGMLQKRKKKKRMRRWLRRNILFICSDWTKRSRNRWTFTLKWGFV